MQLDNCFELGYVVKPHGTQGALSVFLDVDEPEYYKNLESVYVLKQEQLVPFFLDSFQVKGKKAVAKLEDVDSIEEAIALKGCSLHLPIELLPELEDGQFYYHDIIGYQVKDNSRGLLGVVKDVYTHSHQDFVAMDYQEKEILIPVNDEIIVKANHQNKLLQVNLPEGLLEIYL